VTPEQPAPCAGTNTTTTIATAAHCDKHAAKPAKAKHHQKPHKAHKAHADRPQHDRPQAAIDKSKRGHKSGRRLRIHRRTR
jgi:hypothetical protein